MSLALLLVWVGLTTVPLGAVATAQRGRGETVRAPGPGGLSAPQAPPAGDDERLPGLTILQLADGIPNRPEARPSPQRIDVVADRLSLLDSASGHFFLMRLDQSPAGFYELSADRKQYRIGHDFGRIQAERRRQELQLIERASAKPAAERDRELKDNFLNLEREWNTRVERLPHGPVEVGEGADKRKYSVQRYVVTENGRVIVDALLTEDLGITVPFFEFYRHVGAFSDEVLERLRGIPGVPIEATIKVVTATLVHTIHARALEIRPGPIPARVFEIPADAKRVEESEYARDYYDGELVEKASARFVDLPSGERLYFKNRENWQRFVSDYRKKLGHGKAGNRPRVPEGPRSRPQGGGTEDGADG